MFDGIPRDSDASINLCRNNVEEKEEDEIQDLSFFDRLPIEVFLYICSFLEVKDMVLTLSRVCRRFSEILEDETIWRSWIAKRFCSRYPIMPTDNNFDWRGACFDIEKEWNQWVAKDEKVRYINVNDVHISSCDAVLFLNGGPLCVSGSRDRSLIVWNPLLLKERPYQYSLHQVAHDGWIWRLMQVEGTLYSCSWDNTVKSWTIGPGGLDHVSTFSCTSPALAMTSINGLIVAGDYGKTVYAFDPRITVEPQFTYGVHQRAVLTLGAYGNEIISGSEDRTLAMWDVRNKSLRQKVELGKTSYPNCSYIDDQNIFIGDNKGIVHVFTTMEGKTSVATNFKLGHTKAISVLKYGRGSFITGSLDSTIKISVPTYPPQVITTLRSDGGQVGGMDYSNGMLVTGSANCVEFWIPEVLFQS